MEQNLSEKERKQRLAIGFGLEFAAVISYLGQGTSNLTMIFGIGGLGFISNYFTCFCGTKKLVSKLRNSL